MAKMVRHIHASLYVVSVTYVKLTTWLSIKSSGAAVPSSVVVIHRPQAEGFSPSSFCRADVLFLHTKHKEKKSEATVFNLFFSRAVLVACRCLRRTLLTSPSLDSSRIWSPTMSRCHLPRAERKFTWSCTWNTSTRKTQRISPATRRIKEKMWQWVWSSCWVFCGQNIHTTDLLLSIRTWLKVFFSFSSCLACLRKKKPKNKTPIIHCHILTYVVVLSTMLPSLTSTIIFDNERLFLHDRLWHGGKLTHAARWTAVEQRRRRRRGDIWVTELPEVPWPLSHQLYSWYRFTWDAWRLPLQSVYMCLEHLSHSLIFSRQSSRSLEVVSVLCHDCLDRLCLVCVGKAPDWRSSVQDVHPGP